MGSAASRKVLPVCGFRTAREGVVGPGLCPPAPTRPRPPHPALTHATLQAAFGVRNLGGQGKAPVGWQPGQASRVPPWARPPAEP